MQANFNVFYDVDQFLTDSGMKITELAKALGKRHQNMRPEIDRGYILIQRVDTGEYLWCPPSYTEWFKHEID